MGLRHPAVKDAIFKACCALDWNVFSQNRLQIMFDLHHVD
jgi:hypothetical protein